MIKVKQRRNISWIKWHLIYKHSPYFITLILQCQCHNHTENAETGCKSTVQILCKRVVKVEIIDILLVSTIVVVQDQVLFYHNDEAIISVLYKKTKHALKKGSHLTKETKSKLLNYKNQDKNSSMIVDFLNLFFFIIIIHIIQVLH